MKELVFLPDRDGRDSIGSGTGFVRCAATAAELGALAARLAADQAAQAASDTLAWRSALTLALLTDLWTDCGTALTVLPVRSESSAFASWVLAARPEKDRAVNLLLLERGGVRRLLGVADANCGVRLPAAPAPLTDVLPERASWIDRTSGEISDPAPFLSERERLIVLSRMEALGLATDDAADFARDLAAVDAPETDAVARLDAEALERLAVRMEAVCGLKDFEAFSIREEPLADAGSNALLACLGVPETDLHAELGLMRTYLWDGVGFARTSSALGLTGTNDPQMAEALRLITGELTIMSSSSVKWNYQTGEVMARWLERKQGDQALLFEARDRIEASCRLMQSNGRQVQHAVTLTWPWDAGSGAVRALLKEALGDDWLEAASAPFADRLTKLTGCVLGDTVLQTCCGCADGVLLPPLSRELAACAAAAGLNGGLALDAMRFIPGEDGGITASFLLRGMSEIRMERAYGPEELCVLTAEESPCAAVWPCVPMEAWQAYHVFAQGGVEIAVLCSGQWLTLSAEEPLMIEHEPDEEGEALPPTPVYRRYWRCLHTTEYPGCLTVSRDGLCLGTLPNMLPVFHPESKGDATAAIDLGSTQTTVAFAFGGVPEVLEGQQLTRLLVMPQEAPVDGFLASLTPASVQPTAVVVAGEGAELFTDGYAYRPVGMAELAGRDAQTLRTLLKWRSDPETERARELLLHQVMLGAALTATLAGAGSIAWRLTIADEMGDEGREAMLNVMKKLSDAVAQESGLPLAKGVPAVSWAEESAALVTSLRTEGSGRGSCVAVDMGGGSTKAHLWVQGQPRPTVGAVVLEGVQDVLIRLYRREPRWLLDDFADCGDEGLLQAVLAIVDQLNPDLWCPRQQDKVGLMLLTMLDEFRQTIVWHMSARAAAQQPTHMQSVLLETQGAVLFTAGLMLAQVGDNTMLSHLLPEDVSVCLTGRGAWLLESLTPAMRNSLQHLTHAPLRLDHPVRFVTLRPAAKPAQSVATGLAVTRETGRLSDAPQVRTRESFSQLMQRLMQHLASAFPMHMWLLHEGLFDWQTGALTPAGTDTIRRTAARCYGDGEDIPAAILLFVQTLRESAILPDHLADTAV
ncbi:MAG: hypothetical protein IJ343_14705 [Clostridia bacterium]|nr:hypothetical protein [Clostridia bacterium]